MYGEKRMQWSVAVGRVLIELGAGRKRVSQVNFYVFILEIYFGRLAPHSSEINTMVEVFRNRFVK